MKRAIVDVRIRLQGQRFSLLFLLDGSMGDQPQACFFCMEEIGP